MHRVFIYGTLKRGFPNHAAGLKGQRFVGRFRTREHFPLVVAGPWFHPVLIYEPGLGHRVHGEVFEVGDRALARLDFFESTHLPSGYDRVAIAAESVENGAVLEAWAYVRDRARIEAIHTEFLDEYRLDPRYVPAAKRKR